MTSPLSLHSPVALLDTFVNTIDRDIYPLSASAVASGSKLFGAAILLKKDLSLVIADTNQESDSPLWHGETWTISKFFEIPKGQRPDVKECLFLTTHEPCSLCLRDGPSSINSAITWSGFDNFTYMYTYEETHNIFRCQGDLDIFAAVFHRSPTDTEPVAASADGRQKQVRPQYKLQNEFFVSQSFAELVAAIKDEAERQKWIARVEQCKESYGKLSHEYREYYKLGDGTAS